MEWGYNKKMVFTTWGREQTALLIGSDVTNKQISYYAVGTGSATEDNSNKTLNSEWTRFSMTESPDFTEGRKVTFTGDLNSVQASGLSLTEFGLFASGSASTGSCFSREQITGSVVCDGTIELKFETAIEVI